MSNFIHGEDRFQICAFPPTLEETVPQDAIVRVIDAFVDTLDLKEYGFEQSQPAYTGRPAYNPSDLLKLYVYGYAKRTRSSRRLVEAAQENTHAMWLMRKLVPCFKTLAAFRSENSPSFKKVFRAFNELCHNLGLFNDTLVGIDGTKIGASNHNSKRRSLENTKKDLKVLDKEIDRYLKDLEDMDSAEMEHETPEKSDGAQSAEGIRAKVKEALAAAKNRKEKLESLKTEMENTGQTQVAYTDPDSRMMRASTGRMDMSYNVEIAVSAMHKLIVDFDPTNDINDRNQLNNMAVRSRDSLQCENLKVTTDTGFFNKLQILFCEMKEGITCYIPTPAQPNGKYFSVRDFQYDQANNCLICPAGKVLNFKNQTMHENKEELIYMGADCPGCALKEKCTSAEYRKVTRWKHQSVIEAMEARCKAEPEIYALRKELVEHPFGTIKAWMDGRQFLTRGLRKVEGEFALTALAYNLKRVVNILGAKKLIDVLKSIINGDFDPDKAPFFQKVVFAFWSVKFFLWAVDKRISRPKVDFRLAC